MGKKLVAYFSASGVTKNVAETLAKASGADLYEIQPQTPYSREDLDWHNKTSRSSVEMQDKTCRPAIQDNNAKIEMYDFIFLGFPIWWYTAPRIINTFLESYDFTGKKIVLFATSGGSRFGKTADDLKESVTAKTTITEGRILNGKQTIEMLSEWAASLQ